MQKFFRTVLFAFSVVASNMAGATVIDASVRGSYNEIGVHNAWNRNYIAGKCSDCAGNYYYRNFFTFDLNGIVGQITSAILRVDAGFVYSPGTYDLYDVSTAVSLLTSDTSDRTDIYADLGSGRTYGTTDIARTQSYTAIDIILNAAALEDLNAANGVFAIGGAYTGPRFHAFGASQNSPVPQLLAETAAVPEPLPLSLIGLGLAALSFTRRNKKR